jgi:hypothetical protein
MAKQITIRNRLFRLAIAGLACLLSLAISSRTNQPESQRAADQIDSVVREYMRLAVGLGQRDPDSLDYYAGPNSLVEDILRQPPLLSSIRVSALQLIAKITRLNSLDVRDTARRTFLLVQLQAIADRVNVVTGVPSTFDQESKASFGIVAPSEYNEATVKKVHAELERVLPGRGDLTERYQNFDSRFVVPPKLIPAVFARSLEGCRTETLNHISLPQGESVSIEYVGNRPWSAYSRYQGNYRSLIQINTDYALTVDRVLNLACHEAYPGHHAYNSLRDINLVQAGGLKEYLVQPTYSPQSMLSESMATLAVDVAFPEAKRLAFERDVLFPIVGLNRREAALYLRVESLVDELRVVEPIVAREYLDGRLEFERAGSTLEDAALMAHPEAALKYLNEYRSYVTTYTYGRDLVAAQLSQRSGNDDSTRWKTYVLWMLDNSLVLGSTRQIVQAPSSHLGG